MITCGMPGGLSSSTAMRSLPLILPSARALLGDDVVTAGSIPLRARFGASTSRRATWSPRLGASTPLSPTVSISIPCHRVVASDGLGCYSGGELGRRLETKGWLLENEGALSPALV
jgi:6-O-methylguanine DNA methyltransferase, DNA binding domain